MLTSILASWKIQLCPAIFIQDLINSFFLHAFLLLFSKVEFGVSLVIMKYIMLHI
jgi:hypothetical protein